MICTELKPGTNLLVNTELKDNRPPEGFIDHTVKVYKMVDGVKTLVRTEDPFPEGWDKHDFRIANKIASEERRGEEMAKNTKAVVPDNLGQVWIESNYVIDKVAKAYKCGWGTARGWLLEAGLIDNLGTRKLQPPEPEQSVEPESEQTQYELEPQENFTAEDDEPIPYTVAQVFDLAPVKIQLIAATLAEYREGAVPAEIALELVKRIGGL